MRIEFTNPDCTEAIVTRGWFRVRQACVQRRPREYGYAWVYASGDDAYEIASYMELARNTRLAADKRRRNWTAPQLPPARMVRR